MGELEQDSDGPKAFADYLHKIDIKRLGCRLFLLQKPAYGNCNCLKRSRDVQIYRQKSRTDYESVTLR